MLELVFVMAPRQNLFFVEVVAAIRHELDQLGVASSVRTSGFPEPRPERVYVLVPPHEFFALHPGLDPPLELLRRSLYICGEQPGTSHFEENAALASDAAAVFDFSRWSTREYARRGVHAEHFQLGYSPLWDHFDAMRERDVDLLFIGAYTDRRGAALASYGDALWRWRSRIIFADNSAPNWARSARFLSGAEKWQALASAKVLLNIHQGAAPYFEWHRIVQTIANGCVVVTERSAEYEPLVPGEHFLSGRTESLLHLAQTLLEDPDRRARMQRDAYQLLRDELPLRRTVERLVAVAEMVRSRPVPALRGLRLIPPRDDETREADYQPASGADSHDLSAVRAVLKDVRLDLVDLRRELSTVRRHVEGRGSEPQVEIDSVSPAYAAAQPRVSVLTTVFNYAEFITRALDSLAGSRFRQIEAIVVDDGSYDNSVDQVRDWMGRHPRVAAALIRHRTNRGLASARNTALGFARAEYVFVLDADNQVYPHCLERLVGALDEEAGSAIPYGMHERFTHGGPDNLMNVWPWEPARLRGGNYIDAMALIRTSVLRGVGGYTADRRMYGWEDYDLWCHLAELGERAVLVPEVVARYRVARHSMLALTNLSIITAFSVLAERYPRVMGGVVAPL